MPKGTYEIVNPRLVAGPGGVLRPGRLALERARGAQPPVEVNADAMAPLTPEALLRIIHDPR